MTHDNLNKMTTTQICVYVDYLEKKKNDLNGVLRYDVIEVIADVILYLEINRNYSYFSKRPYGSPQYV